MMCTDFYYRQREHQLKLLKENFFEGAQGFGSWLIKGMPHDYEFILKQKDSTKNLYAPILNEVLEYFRRNNIIWWRQEEDGYFPSGHLLSSQNNCLNHLFAISRDYKAVLSIVKGIGKSAGIDFDDVMPSFIDKVVENEKPQYISFEFVYHNKELLNESHETRGALCTSIDAVIYAKAGNEKWLIPIEWKYTENYDTNRKTHIIYIFNRYSGLIGTNSHLQKWEKTSIYNINPFYEFARQSLLAERIIEFSKNKGDNDFCPDVDKYLHVIVIPEQNRELNFLAGEFRNSLKNDCKDLFRITSPYALLKPVEENYKDLFSYLRKRYGL